MTEPESLQQVDRTYVRYRGRKFSYFSGCDYFRLASHPAVLKAAADGLKQFGLNVSASRITTGNHRLYCELENELAQFFDADAAVLLPTGYLASHAITQALAGNFSHVLIDESCHAALQDAARLLDCPLLKFTHGDPENLAQTIRRCGPGARIVVLTDGLFAFDGSVAPLKAYLQILPRDAWIIVDDAHGAGVIGANGKGTLEAQGVNRNRIIRCITLSKAFGSYGGAVLGSRKVRKQILSHSRMYIGSTPIPLPLANAALAAVRTVKANPSFRSRLQTNVNKVKDALRSTGFKLPESPTPIVTIELESEREISNLKRRLLARRIYPPFVKYPGSPRQGHFRFVISSEHSSEQLQNLIAAVTSS